MVAKYPLYFDSVRRDSGVTAKRVAIVLIVLLHAFFFWRLDRDRTSFIAPLSRAMILVDFNSSLLATPVASKSSITKTPHKVVDTAHTSAVLNAPVATPTTDGPDITDAGTNDLAMAGNARAHSGVTPAPIFHPPRVLTRPKMFYPRDAFDRHEEGSADVLVNVAPDGSLIDASIQRSTGSESLDSATLASVRSYTFQSATRGNQAVSAQAVVEVDWSISAATQVQNGSSVANPTADSENMRRALNRMTVPCKVLQQKSDRDPSSPRDLCGPMN